MEQVSNVFNDVIRDDDQLDAYQVCVEHTFANKALDTHLPA